MMQAVQASPKRSVSVETTARLHMGFIDLNGGLGRRFGSVGLTLNKPATRLKATAADEFSATGPEAERALAIAQRFAAKTGIQSGACLDIQAAIPMHAGLGSGTQLALAVGVALSRLFQLGLSLDSIAEITGRGMRSGIGVGAFLHGGLLVDGGRGAATRVPPIVARMDFPPVWRILLVFDARDQGVHGQNEVKAFAELPPFPAEYSAHIARLILMQALPSVAEQDLTGFGRAIGELQRMIGDHFGPAQGGGRYASAEVASAMAWLESEGVQCTGQSSWGPTGFAVIGSEKEAERLRQGLQMRNPQLQYEICQARNEGSIIMG